MLIKDRRQTSAGEFFTVELDNGIEIKDCKVVNGAKGRFVSGPAKKVGEKWFNLVYFGDVASKQVLSLYDGGAGGASASYHQEPEFNPDDDIPFIKIPSIWDAI